MANKSKKDVLSIIAIVISAIAILMVLQMRSPLVIAPLQTSSFENPTTGVGHSAEEIGPGTVNLSGGNLTVNEGNVYVSEELKVKNLTVTDTCVGCGGSSGDQHITLSGTQQLTGATLTDCSGYTGSGTGVAKQVSSSIILLANGSLKMEDVQGNIILTNESLGTLPAGNWLSISGSSTQIYFPNDCISPGSPLNNVTIDSLSFCAVNSAGDIYCTMNGTEMDSYKTIDYCHGSESDCFDVGDYQNGSNGYSISFFRNVA